MNTLPDLSRRDFLANAALAALAATAARLPLPSTQAAAQRALPEPSAKQLPRWRGFNLLEKFNGRNDPFVEQDFAWIAELGFNFVRLPMDYRAWVEKDDWTKFREPTLKEIDDAIRFGERHGLHVHLNFHRAPGYTVARPPEAKPVWTDDEALRVCALHWATFAKRYQGIPNRQLSFNPFNEPARLEPDSHKRVIARVAEAIREQDPQRLILCDGRDWGNEPPSELAGLGVAAATRGYRPMRLTHYRASWVNGADKWETPTYPLKEGDALWDKASMRQRCIEPWKKLQAQGLGVMVGEFGAYNKTPHPVTLAWMRDCLDLWQEAGWGWAMWNFRGPFGILDSGRADVKYDQWRGHKLDRAMLELIQAA
jgi:endoglucanase